MSDKNTQAEGLEACPFCGGKPGYSVEGFVFCHDCGSEGPEASVEGEPGMARRDAIAAWNTRSDAQQWRDRALAAEGRAQPSSNTCQFEPLRIAQQFGAEIVWLREAARYFSNCPTNGEDSAHWANVFNAENANKLADRLAALTPEPDHGARTEQKGEG